VDLANAIAHAKAEAWVADEDDGTFGLGDGSCAVSLAFGEEGSTRASSIRLGAPTQGGVYAQLPPDPAVFVAPATLREMAARLLVDRSLVRVDTGRARTITLVRGEARLVLSRVGDALRLEGQTDADGGTPALEAALASVFAQSVVHLGRARGDEGFDTPTLDIRVRLVADGGQGERHISIGSASTREGGNVYLARVSGVDATFAVPGAPIETLLDRWPNLAGRVPTVRR
jgi:hypothetical protein